MVFTLIQIAKFNQVWRQLNWHNAHARLTGWGITDDQMLIWCNLACAELEASHRANAVRETTAADALMGGI